MSKINEKILLILAILCIFIIIPCSFASDNDNTALTDSVVADENSIYVSVDGSDTNGTGTEANPYQSISKAVESYSSTNSNIYVKNGTYKFDGSVKIEKGIVIVGESNTGVIFDGNNASAIFAFDTTKSVLISDITFTNGYSDGAAIVVDAPDFVANNCIFENNNGGAITSSGGFMEWYPVNIKVINSEFINNYNSGNGAAISIGAIYASLNVTDCVFVNNTASNRGGAISLSNLRMESFISGSRFVSNSATTGSAIYMNNGYTISIFDNEFIENTASADGAVIDLEAYSYSTILKVNLKGNTFTDNYPSTEIVADGLEIVYLDKNVRLVGEDIETMNVGSDVYFTATLTDDSGNPISGKTITFTFTDVLKRSFTHVAVTGADGKAVIALANQTAGTFTVVSSFAGDSTYDAVNATNSVKIKAEHSYNIVFNESIVKVKAGDSHKVMAYVCGEYITPVLIFTNYDITWRTISGGTRTTTNGAISGSSFVVDVIDFDLSTSSEYYYINFTARADSTEVTASGTLIVDTSIPLPPVDKDIEVIYVAKDGSDEFGDGTEDNPLATVQTALYVNELYGGNKIVYVKEGTYDVSNFEVYANVTVIGEKSKTIFRQTQGDDGMLYLDNGATVKFTNVTFIDGYEAEYTIYGAVIVVRYAGSIAYFDGCEFYNNHGSSDGVIYVAYNAVAYFDNCRFENNTAWTFNAAGVIEVHDAYLSVNNSYFGNNTASEGAGIFVGGDAYATIENTVFYQNKALNDSYAVSGGGAIYVNNWNTYITNCSFIENYADVNGGAIYILIGKVEIDRCLFENNHVQAGSGKGSAIASDSGYTVLLYVENSVFISDDYSKMIAIVNDLAEENEIKIDNNYWGTSVQSGTKNHVIIQATTSFDEIREGDQVEITVEFKDNSGNKLNKSVHDFTLNIIPQLGSVDVDSITIIDNVAKFNYFANKTGEENIIFKHGEILYTYKFTVNASEFDRKDFNANITVNDNKTQVIVEVPASFEDNITIKVDSNAYSVKANNGVATLDINELPGKHTVQVSFAGDDEYKAFVSDLFTFTIDKYETNLAIFVADAVAGDDVVVNVTANDKFSGKVSVIINNKTHAVDVNNGQGSLTLTYLASGIYTAEAIFEGNDYFNVDNADTTFEISKSLIDVIYVSAEGNDSNNGSQLSPFASISKALDTNKRLGGNRTIVISEGNYILNRYAITNDVSIIGQGNVVISQNANTNHIYIGGNVNVALEGLTFINGNGVQSGSIDTGSDDAGNIGKTLTITNCNFINNTGVVGAVTSYAETTITKSSFINNTATGKTGYNQAIISIQDNAADLENNIFLNNNYVNEIIVSRVAGSANNNFWGSNNKPDDVDDNLIIGSWVCVVPTIDEDVRAKTNYEIDVKFQSTTDGINFVNLDNAMPDLMVSVDAKVGQINPVEVLISANIGSSNYIVDKKGYDTISVNLNGKTIASIEFIIDIPEADKIYVSINGSDSNTGSRDFPLQTIKEALAQNKAAGGNKTIVLLPGEFKEQDLLIDTLVTIIGENATISGNGGNIFVISADAEIAHISIIDSADAIKQLGGILYIYDSEFINNTNAIVANDNLKVEDILFAQNNNAIISNYFISIDDCVFVQNTGVAVYCGNISLIGNSLFEGNGFGLKLEDSVAVIENNIFENNGVAIDTLKTDALIKNNKFNNGLIVLNESVADLVENANATIRLISSNITNAVVSFMQGSTIIVNNGTIELNATVRDSMGNIIDGGKITFTSNGEEIGTVDVENGVAILSYPFTKGNHTISGTFDSDKNAIITDGLVRVDVDYYWFIGEIGYENLEDAISAAELGDVIKGIPGTYNIGKLRIGHRYFDNEPWEIFKSITITSIDDSPVTLKGSGVQMFFLDIGSELTLKNLIIRDAGSSSDDGGAIETLYNTNLTIINCTFTNNNGGDGGAIYVIGTTNLEIRDTVFDSNTGLMAGALQIVAYGRQDITLKNLTFINNKAHYAGAFYNGGAELEISGSRFINNTASVGGAMYTNGGSVTVIDSEFIANSAISNDAVTSTSMGGAFHNLLADATFKNVKFIDNYADGLGGAMELENGLYGTVTWTVIENCTFVNNTAREGGAIFLGDNYDPYVKISSSVFDSNTAQNNGAAISDNFGHVTVTTTEFKNNKAGGMDIVHVEGDIVESTIYNGELTITDCEFTSNDADYVIFTNAYGIVNVIGTKFDTHNMVVFNRGEANLRNNIVTNSSDNVIENLGTLSVYGNVFDTPIINKNEIRSLTYVVILGNETISAPSGENYVLKAVITDDQGNIIVSGDVNFVVNGTLIPSVYKNNEFSANYTVTEGVQVIDATIVDDGLVQIKVKTATIFGKFSPELSVVAVNTSVGDVAEINVNVNSQATGNVTITINNQTYELAVNKGTAKLEIADLVSGEYPIEVTYLGDENYAPASESLTLVVSKVSDYKINVDVEKVGLGDVTIVISLPGDAGGYAMVLVDSEEYPVIIYNGRTSLGVSNLAVGTHNLTINYEGDVKYAGSTFKTTFKVAKLESNINITAPDCYLGNVAVITVNAPGDANGDVIINVDGKDYLTTLSNGKAIVELSDLDLGTHTVTATYYGDAQYLDSTSSATFNVIEYRTADINITIDDSVAGVTPKMTLDLPDDATGSLIVNIDGKTFANVEVVNGSASVVLDNVAPGAHVVEVKYSGDGKYPETSKVAAVVVKDTSKIGTVIIIASKVTRVAVDTAAGEKGDVLYATLKDANGNPLVNKSLQIAFNGKIYDVVTDGEGQAGIVISINTANTYSYVVSFSGEDKYTAAPLAMSKVTVTKKTTSIKASSKTFKAAAKSKTISVTLKTTKNPYTKKVYLKSGKKLTLKVNGKTYTAKTNSKGVAKFTVKLTKKSKYTAVIKFNGDKTYKASTKKIKITIK